MCNYKCLRFEQDRRIAGNIIKDVRNLFRLKQKIKDKKEKWMRLCKDIRNLFRLYRKWSYQRQLIRDFKNLFEQEEVHCYKLVRIGNFWNNNSIKHESNGDKNKTLSIIKYIDLKIKSGTYKIQLTIAINFMTSKDNE